MFTSPNWIWLEVLVIIAIVSFFAVLIGVYIYKKVHHIPTGDCACCHKSTKQLLKEYHKECSHK